MDRQIVFPGQIPLETDLLNTNRNVLVGIGMLALDILGSSTVSNGLACTQLGVPALSVQVAPGRLYVLQNVDGTAYSSLPADTTHQILKQGILLDAVQLACPAPVTAGFSVNYLIQATYQDVDTSSVTLPYYNASNPTQAYSGPNNSGTPQATQRKGTVVLTAKAGIAAATGSQTTPAPDAGYLGLYVVTVAFGQATILNANIATYSGAFPIGNSLPAINSAIALLTSRLNGWINVMDTQWAGGAKGDGVTNDLPAIQAAASFGKAAGKAVYFPTPSVYYKTNGPINAGGSSHWVGENGAATTIRNTAGGIVVTCDSFGSLGPYVFEQLRFGGAGAIGIASTPTSFNGSISGTTLTVNSGLVGGIQIGGTVTGAGVTAGTIVTAGSGSTWTVNMAQTVGPVTMTMTNQYVSKLTLRHCQFEGDLLTGVDANLIFANWQDTGFGIYVQTAYNANFTCFKSIGNGVLNTNLNSYERCQFYGSTGLYAVWTQAGGLHRFKDCDWEGNVRNLTASNLSGLVIDNGYTERVLAATGQAFDFGVSRTRVKVIGGQYNGATLATGVSMFGASSNCPLLVEDADISTSALAFAYINSSVITHTPPISGLHHFRNVRIAGNAADPLLFLDGIIEDGVNAFTPTPSGLTVVNGTGGATYSGTWSIRNRMVTVTIRIVTTGTCTTAATAGTTYFPLPTNLPLPQVPGTGGVVNEVTQASLGVGMAYTNGRFLVPAWSAQAGNIAMSVTYPI